MNAPALEGPRLLSKELLIAGVALAAVAAHLVQCIALDPGGTLLGFPRLRSRCSRPWSWAASRSWSNWCSGWCASSSGRICSRASRSSRPRCSASTSRGRSSC